MKKTLIFLLISLSGFTQNITEILSFQQSRFSNDNSSLPVMYANVQNRMPDVNLSNNKLFIWQGKMPAGAFTNKGVNCYGGFNSPVKKFMDFSDNELPAGQQFENLTDSQLDQLAGNYNWADVLLTDLEFRINHSHPNTARNYTYLLNKIKQNKPSMLVGLFYEGTGARIFGNSNLYVTPNHFRCIQNQQGYDVNSVMAAQVFSNYIDPNVGWVYEPKHGSVQNKSLAEVEDICVINSGGYQGENYYAPDNEDGLNTNTAFSATILGELNGIEMLKRKPHTKRVILAMQLHNEYNTDVTNYVVNTTEGQIQTQMGHLVAPNKLELQSFMSFWKGDGLYVWTNRFHQVTNNNDAMLTSSYFTGGPFAFNGNSYANGFYPTGNYNQNYNQNYYNNLYQNQMSIHPYGVAIDAVHSGVQKYSQVEQLGFTNATTQLPTQITYSRANIDNSGNQTFGASTTFTPATNGAVYAEAQTNKRPIVEYKKVGNSYVLVCFDLFANNGTNKTKINATIDGNNIEVYVCDGRISVFKIN